MSYMTYEEGYKKIWSTFNALRGVFDMYECGTLVLYMVTLYNNKRVRESLDSSDEPLSLERLSVAIRNAVQKDETGRTKVLLEIFDILGPNLITTHHETASRYGSFGLLSYRPTALQDTYNIISSIDDLWYTEHLPHLFEDFLFRLAEIAGKSAGNYVQPIEVTRLVTYLSGYKGVGSIYYPYAGCGSYAVEMHPKNNYIGEEFYVLVWAIAVMRMMANGLDPETIKHGETSLNWKGIDNCKKDGHRFDYIVSTPPFGLRIPQQLREDVNTSQSFRMAEEDFLYRGSLSLNPNGTLVGVFSMGVTFRETPAEKGLRRELVERGLVSNVILLPGNLFFGTAIPSVIIQLKNAESDGTITMMDASTFFKKEGRRNILCLDELITALNTGNARYVRKVSIDDVRNNDYSLVPPKYLMEDEAIPEGYVSYRVSDLISSVKAESVSLNETRGHILNPANLSKTAFAYEIESKTLNKDELKAGFSKMSEPFIAVSKVGALRPTLVQADTYSPVYFSNSIAAYKLDGEQVYLPLFLYELRRRSEALPEIGVTIRRISMKDVMELTLHFPATLDEQKSLYARLENQDKLAKARELGLEEIIASQKRDYINMLRSRKHDLDNCLGAAKNDFSALSKSLKRMRMSDGDLMNIPLADGLEITVGEQLQKIKQLLDKMSVQIKHFTDENVYGEVEKVDLIAKLHAIQAHGNYVVKYETDLTYMPHDGGSILEPVAFVRFNSSDLDRVIDNIVRNAEKHGFKDPDFKYTLKVLLSYDYTDKMYVVEFQNNGLPMPKGMDSLRYGIDGERGKDSDGQGKGGSIVKEFVEHFGGKYEVYNEPDALFPVGILIKLPIYED